MFFNRDLSWLGFNFRVLLEAADRSVPLYERINFLSIFSSNLDEFFRVRYPSVIASSKLTGKTQMETSGGDEPDIAEKMQSEINCQLNTFGSILTNDIIPDLRNNGIFFYYNEPVKDQHISEIRDIFLSQVLSFIQPIFLEGNISSKFIPENNQLYFIISLKSDDRMTNRHAIVDIPSDKLPRFFVLEKIEDTQYVIFIDDIIRENLNCIFPGNEIDGVYSIKFNRDAELELEDEYSEDVVNEIEKQLRKREYGPPSRFLFEQSMPQNVQLYMESSFGLKAEEMFKGGRYHNLRDLASLPSFNKNLKYEKWKPLALPYIINCGDIFNILNSKDILLHLPFESYNPVLSFFNQAAVDTAVKEIYITLYRVAADSHIVNALISAAKNGKKVVAFVELKARFDEENNIKWSRIMQDAGIQIIYSIPRIKVHSKIAVIKKTSGNDLLTYAILSTGNFNEVTAKFYTDHVLMTTDPSIIGELLTLFTYLQEDEKFQNNTKIEFEKLLVSQFNMNEKFEKLINHEIQKANLGQEALIRIKVNNLEEPNMINLLYKASQAGVNVHLIVRGICCLVPAVPGVSDKIIVRRLVDRYLEHTRLFIFGAGDDPEVIMGSADWMVRNLHHRIEVCVPVKNTTCKQELLDYFAIQWSDTDKAVVLSSKLEQHPAEVADGEKLNAQRSIYQYLQKRV